MFKYDVPLVLSKHPHLLMGLMIFFASQIYWGNFRNLAHGACGSARFRSEPQSVSSNAVHCKCLQWRLAHTPWRTRLSSWVFQDRKWDGSRAQKNTTVRQHVLPVFFNVFLHEPGISPTSINHTVKKTAGIQSLRAYWWIVLKLWLADPLAVVLPETSWFHDIYIYINNPLVMSHDGLSHRAIVQFVSGLRGTKNYQHISGSWQYILHEQKA